MGLRRCEAWRRRRGQRRCVTQSSHGRHLPSLCAEVKCNIWQIARGSPPASLVLRPMKKKHKADAELDSTDHAIKQAEIEAARAAETARDAKVIAKKAKKAYKQAKKAAKQARKQLKALWEAKTAPIEKIGAPKKTKKKTTPAKKAKPAAEPAAPAPVAEPAAPAVDTGAN